MSNIFTLRLSKNCVHRLRSERSLSSGYRKVPLVMLALAVLVTVVASGLAFLDASVPNVSAVTVVSGLGVYWDRSCSKVVTRLDWGVLSPGDVRDIAVYVRNEGSETFVLVLTPSNWSPQNAASHMSVALHSADTKIDVGQVAAVTLSLSVSPSMTGVTDFSFDVALEGREFFVGDINRDGSVDSLDLALMGAAMWSTPTDLNWNPRADLRKDGAINVRDLTLICSNFGKSW